MTQVSTCVGRCQDILYGFSFSEFSSVLYQYVMTISSFTLRMSALDGVWHTQSQLASLSRRSGHFIDGPNLYLVKFSRFSIGDTSTMLLPFSNEGLRVMLNLWWHPWDINSFIMTFKNNSWLYHDKTKRHGRWKPLPS